MRMWYIVHIAGENGPAMGGILVLWGIAKGLSYHENRGGRERSQ